MSDNQEEIKREQIKQDAMQKVKQVNEMLLQGEPENVSIDTYSGYSGYKPQYVLDAMNEVFGLGGWGFEEVSSELVSEDKLAVTQVRVWLEGITSQPVGWGQARVTKGDLGDARKGAQTDAIKKALSYFSIGNRAYRGQLPDGKNKNNQQQMPRQNTVKPQQQTSQGNSQETPENITQDQINSIRKLCQYLKKNEPDNVTSIKFLAARKIIQELTSEYKEKRSQSNNKAS